MTDETKPPRRTVTVRRTLAAGTVAATAIGTTAGTLPASAAATQQGAQLSQAESGGEGEGGGDSCAGIYARSGGEGEAAPHGEGEASGEGEGENASSGGGEGEAVAGGEGEGEGGAPVDPQSCLARDLAIMQGHLRVGLALLKAGDREAAEPHLAHPMKEQYAAVAAPLDARGYGGLADKFDELTRAVTEKADMDEVQSRYDAVTGTLEEVRGEMPAKARLLGLALTAQVAADEYAEAFTDGGISNPVEYQDAWGFLEMVKAAAGELADADDEAVAKAAATIRDQAAGTEKAFGGLEGERSFEAEPGILYGAASRMDLAARSVR